MWHPPTSHAALLPSATPPQSQDNETASLLLDHGADTNKPNPQGVTPLLVAVNNADDANVAYLLNKGADPGQASSDGTTPLLAAVSTGQNATIQVGIHGKCRQPLGACPCSRCVLVYRNEGHAICMQ